MENVYRFFRRVSFSYKMSSVLNDWRAFFTIDLLIPLMQMMCYSLVGYYVYGAENIEKWVISNAIVTSAFTAIYRVGLQLARERASGTLSLMLATKTSISEILISSAISTMLLSFVSVVFGVSVLSLLLGLDWNGQKVLEFVFILILAIFVATCFGFFISCLILLTTEIHLVTNTIDKVLLIFTGANFPVSNFPYLVEQFCYTLPLTRSILLAQKLIGEEVLDYILAIDAEFTASYERIHEIREAIKAKDSVELEKYIDMDTKGLSKGVAKAINTMKKHKEYMLNSVKYVYSNGPLEGFNNKIKLLKRVSYGYSSFSNFRLRILIMSRLFVSEYKNNVKLSESKKKSKQQNAA